MRQSFTPNILFVIWPQNVDQMIAITNVSYQLDLKLQCLIISFHCCISFPFTINTIKASFTLFRCTPRCVPAVCSRRDRGEPGRIGKEFECVHTFPAVLRLCPGHRRQSPGITTASDGSWTTKPRCYTVAYEYQWNSRGTYTRGPRGPWNAHLRQKIFKSSLFSLLYVQQATLGGLNLKAIVL